jgi:carbamoyl-phosphate synthase large subunit
VRCWDLRIPSAWPFSNPRRQPSCRCPLEGTVLITVTDKDKPGIIEPVRLFREMGFRIMATEGTQKFLAEYGIDSEPIFKLGHGRPDIVDAIKNREIHLVINTPGSRTAKEDDSYIRKAAIKYKVLNIRISLNRDTSRFS